MTLRELLRAVWLGRWFLVGTLVVTLAAGYWFAAHQTVDYRATALVQLGSGEVGDGNVMADPDPSRVTADAVMELAESTEDVGTIAGRVSATFDGDKTMAIDVQDPDADAAVRDVNAVASAYVASLPGVIAEQVAALDEQIARASEQVTAARNTIAASPNDPVASALEAAGTQQLATLTATKTAFATLVRPGTVVQTAHEAMPLALSQRNVLGLAFLGGLVAGVGLALARSALDQRVRTPAQAARSADAPVLAQISGVKGAVIEAQRDDRLPVASRVATPFTESIRELRTAVQVGLEHRDHVAVVVSAADPRAPRAFVAANLAVSFALSGRRTIVLSGDMRRPQIDAMLPPPVGWSGPAHQLRPTRVPHLEVCPVPEVELDPADFLATQRARELIESLCRRAGIVVIDAPPILAAADATILGAYAEGVVLVVGAGRTDQAVLAEASERLRTNDVPLLGLAVAGVRGNRRTDYASTYGDAAAEAWVGTQGQTREPTAAPGGAPEPPEPAAPRGDTPTQMIPAAAQVLGVVTVPGVEAQAARRDAARHQRPGQAVGAARGRVLEQADTDGGTAGAAPTPLHESA